MNDSNDLKTKNAAKRRQVSPLDGENSTASSSVARLRFTEPNKPAQESIALGAEIGRMTTDTTFVLVWQSAMENLKDELLICAEHETAALKAEGRAMARIQAKMVELYAIAEGLNEERLQTEEKAQLRDVHFE